jgi:hypothetical protein
MDLYSSGPDLAIPEPILLQHFYLGLSEKSAQFLDITSGGAFLHLPISKGKAILDTILKNSPYTNVHRDSLEEKDNPIPTQEDVSTAKSMPNLSKFVASNHIRESFLGTPKEEEIHPLEFSFEFEEDLSLSLSLDVGNTINHPIQERSLAFLTPNHHLLYSSQDLFAQEPLESTSFSTSDFDLPGLHPCFFVDNSNQGGTSPLLVDTKWEHKSSEARIPIPMEDEDGNPLIECHRQEMPMCHETNLCHIHDQLSDKIYHLLIFLIKS